MASPAEQQKVEVAPAPAGGLHSPLAWAGVSAAAAAVGYLAMLPSVCAAVGQCKATHDAIPVSLNSHTVGVLMAILMMEVSGLVSTYQGVRQTAELVPQIRSRCLPSLLLVSMFAVLVTQHTAFAAIGSPWYAHSAEATARPVYTMTYIEWLIIVPVLLVMSGHCAMGRPMHEMTRPVVVTNVYIVFSWMAQITGSEAVRWGLIVMTFSMYAWASVDMLQWVADYFQSAPKDLPLRVLRPCLSVGLIALFAFYGVVYIFSLLDIISSRTERSCFLFLDVGAKLAMSATFVMIRTREYHSTFSSLLQKVSSSNVGLISILRGSFDLVLPCDVDSTGSCRLPQKLGADMNSLSSALGRQVGGWDVADLMPNQQERSAFQSYVTNTLRQAMRVGGLDGATLSPDGDWSSSSGAQPPIAHVLNCSLAAKTPGGARIVQCSIHLSVIPRFALVDENRSQVVAALRLHDATLPEEHGALASVKEAVVDTSAPTPAGLVASLSDVAALGVSHLLRGDDAATQVSASNVSSAKAEFKAKDQDKIKVSKAFKDFDQHSEISDTLDSVSTTGARHSNTDSTESKTGSGSQNSGSRTGGSAKSWAKEGAAEWGPLPPIKPVAQQ